MSEATPPGGVHSAGRTRTPQRHTAEQPGRQQSAPTRPSPQACPCRPSARCGLWSRRAGAAHRPPPHQLELWPALDQGTSESQGHCTPALVLLANSTSQRPAGPWEPEPGQVPGTPREMRRWVGTEVTLRLRAGHLVTERGRHRGFGCRAPAAPSPSGPGGEAPGSCHTFFSGIAGCGRDVATGDTCTTSEATSGHARVCVMQKSMAVHWGGVASPGTPGVRSRGTWSPTWP